MFTSLSSKVETTIESSALSRKIKRVELWEMELFNPHADANFDYENIDSLWYRNLDYGTFHC